MKKISFYDTKPYDKIYFDQLKDEYGFEISYFEEKLYERTAITASGSDAVCAFVNDDINAKTIELLYDQGIRVIAMRCAGYNNIDFKAAYEKIHVVRVPAYSPNAVAEHTMALLLSLNRHLHRAYNRTRDYNFSLNGLTGFDLNGKTIGVVGTGKIGRTFIEICKGFGLHVIAYDPYPAKDADFEYVSFEEICRQADIISLHCPLTRETRHIVNKDSIARMKDGVFILNTSRGALINSQDLLEGIRSKKIGAAGLDVYEEETDLFYEDLSDTIPEDEVISALLAMPNVLVTSHQAFLTHEALHNIARVTFENLKAFFDGDKLDNEICYYCEKNKTCDRSHQKRCF